VRVGGFWLGRLFVGSKDQYHSSGYVVLTNWVVESETYVGSHVHLVGASISFEKNFYQLPFTPPSLIRRFGPSNGDFQEPDKIVNVLFSGLPTKCSQKLTLREVLIIEPAVPTPLRWSEVPITFSRADQWKSSSEPVGFPLVLKPVVAGSKLNKVLINGGSGLHVFYTKTMKKMKLDITEILTKGASPFYGTVSGNAAIPLGSVVLLVTFGEPREYYRTEYIKFEVADFETSYHTILGRPAIAKFMEVPTTPTWYSKCQVLPEYSRCKGT
jgi:hypothetical protein